jgi:hypothetical protein
MDKEHLATPDRLGDRIMEFLTAHPYTKVFFHDESTCGRGKSKSVFANWTKNAEGSKRAAASNLATKAL